MVVEGVVHQVNNHNQEILTSSCKMKVVLDRLHLSRQITNQLTIQLIFNKLWLWIVSAVKIQMIASARKILVIRFQQALMVVIRVAQIRIKENERAFVQDILYSIQSAI